MESYNNNSFDISYNYCKFGGTLYALYSLEPDNKYSVIDKWSLFIEKGRRIYKAWRELFTAGAFLVVLGLCFEPFQGGIKRSRHFELFISHFRSGIYGFVAFKCDM
ncbi:hypothetical protein NXX19_27820 [Bacteroides ovatus]|nr:hypothetical protein [Bacteroides ovatus]